MTGVQDPTREMGGDITFWKLVVAIQTATLVAMIVFLARPEIDLEFSRLFFSATGGFVMAEAEAAIAARDAFRLAFRAVCVFVIVQLARTLLLGGGTATSARHWGLVAAVLAIGPGLMANEVFKDNWGRARPDAVEAFGGSETFVPPFLLSDACARNCSFVSGEAAAWAAAALVFGALLWGGLSPARRVWMVAALGAPALAAGLLRVAMGRHFLSDVVFAWLLCALVVAALCPLFGLANARRDFTLDSLAADGRDTLHDARALLLTLAGGALTVGGRALRPYRSPARMSQSVGFVRWILAIR